MDDQATRQKGLERARARLDGKPYAVVCHSEDLDFDGLFGYALDRVESFETYEEALVCARKLEADLIFRYGTPKNRCGTRAESGEPVTHSYERYMRFERGWCSRIDVRIEIRKVPSGRVVDEVLPSIVGEWEITQWLLQEATAAEPQKGSAAGTDRSAAASQHAPPCDVCSDPTCVEQNKCSGVRSHTHTSTAAERDDARHGIEHLLHLVTHSTIEQRTLIDADTVTVLKQLNRLIGLESDTPADGKADKEAVRPRYVEPESDWSNPTLRAQLRIGTVLETYDFGYIRVIDITPDGVVSLGGSFPRYLWEWDELTRLKCTIHVQPRDPSGADTLSWNPGRVSNSGGALELSTEDGAAGNPSVPKIEQALGRELTRLASPSLMRMELHVSVRADGAGEQASPPPLTVSISTDAGGLLEPNETTRELVVRLRDFLLECQGSTWSELRFAVWRVGEKWRYSADYEYE